MNRHIICPSCCDKRGAMHPEDAAMGFTERIVIGMANKPEDHNVKIYTGHTMDSMSLQQTIKCETLVCDHCNKSIMDGEEAVAITMWRPSVEAEPGDWEEEYLL